MSRPRSLKPPSKNLISQRMRRVLAKHPDGGPDIGSDDYHELMELFLWRYHPRSMERYEAKLNKAVKEVYDEIVRRSLEIQKLERELCQYVSDKLG